MRSGRKNSSACSKGNNGKIHCGKTWIKRETNRGPPRSITIGSQQVHRKRKRQPPNNREHRNNSANRPNDYSPHEKAQQQIRNLKTLLPNMHRHTAKRFNVCCLQKRNATRMGGKMLFLSRTADLNVNLFCFLKRFRTSIGTACSASAMHIHRKYNVSNWSTFL